ncbi:MAG: hypothetical protein ACR2FF_08330 [Mycobacteriales bacterium]
MTAAVPIAAPRPDARVPARPGGRRSAARSLRERMFQPGWPIVIGYVAFPLWWILGLGEFIFLILAAIMARELIRRGHVRAPRGFGWWLLFLATVAISFGVLAVDAPGAIPGGSHLRYVTLLYRLIWYAAVGVVLLYVGNTRDRASTQRICRALAWMFVFVMIGGFLGSLAPHLSFPSVLEVVLPNKVSQAGFLHSQIHPSIAQIDNVYGTQTIRPSAPFPYANEWGINFACYLPFFVLTWCRPGAGWRRVAGPIVLLLAVVPVVYSLNRGLWGALLAMALFVAIRAAIAGRVGALLGLLGILVVASGVVLASPLGTRIETRLSSHPSSNTGRTNLATLGVQSVLKKSPVLGYGSTRNVQGTFSSIAGGDSALCPKCSPPALGTQGQLWLISFSQGMLGISLYVVFFLVMFFRHLRIKTAVATAALAVLVVQFVTLIVYNSIGPAFAAIMISAGLLWRESVAVSARSGSLGGAQDRQWLPLARYGALVRNHRVLVGGCLIVGLAAGLAWPKVHHTDAVARVSILVPDDPQYEGVAATTDTMDTEAQLAAGSQTARAISTAIGRPVSPGASNLQISADANSRVLDLAFTAHNAATASKAVMAAAQELIGIRTTTLKANQVATVTALSVRASGYTTALKTVDAALANLQGDSGRSSTALPPQRLQTVRGTLLAQINRANAEFEAVQTTPLPASYVVRGVTVAQVNGVTAVAASSGLVLGLIVGAAAAAGQSAFTPRLGRRRAAASTGLPVFCVLDRHLGQDVGGDELGRSGKPRKFENPGPILDLLRKRAPAVAIAAGPGKAARSVAEVLDRALVAAAAGDTALSGGRTMVRSRPASARPIALLVASRRTRVRVVERAREDIERSGCEVGGLVLVR